MRKAICLLNSIKFYIIGAVFILMLYTVVANSHTFDVHLDPAGDYIRDIETYEKECEKAYERINADNERDGDYEKAQQYIDRTYS